MTLFLRIIDVPVAEKAAALREAIRNPHEQSFEVETDIFAEIPGSPLAYWAPPKAVLAFSSFKALQGDGRMVVSTNPLNADFRYVRLWWEAPLSERSTWRTWAKGGAFSPFYYDPDTVITWDEGRSTFSGFLGTKNRPLERPACVQHFFRPGLTWPRRTNGLSFRVLPGGCIFADKGPAAFCEGDEPVDLLALCALLNSQAFGFLVSIQLARTELAQSYEVGLIQQTPIPGLQAGDREALARYSHRIWSLMRTLDSIQETSRAFILPAALRARLGFFEPAIIQAELTGVQRKIDDITFRIYGLDGYDREAIEAWGAKTAYTDNELTELDSGQAAKGSRTEEPRALSPDAMGALYSWVVGVSFGRFDQRLALGEREAPMEPNPFDPLPLLSPGMVPESGDVKTSGSSVFVDDPGQAHDLAAKVMLVLDQVGMERPERSETLRQWLAREFFALHIKRYSRSHRKAPIYWQLATPAASYSVWLYLHAFTSDTLYKVQNEYVAPKLAHEERKLESLRSELGTSPKATQRKELEAQESFVEELRAFLAEVKRVAPLWNPDLDDGVIINFAPLWRLVPQHKIWQKELKATWDALCAGEYDWAHLAMHLWPERVVPKCATDRSLAIAHGLEEVFWEEGEKEKWKPRSTPTRPVKELVEERTSPAVKTALQSLLEAPTVGTSGGKGRAGRKRKDAGGEA